MRSKLFLASGFLFSLVLAAWLSPENLSALGIMDVSLASENPMVRNTALVEIKAAKVCLVLMAALMVVMAIFMPSFLNSAWYRNIPDSSRGFVASYEQNQRRVFTTTAILGWISVLLGALYIVYGEETFTAEALSMIGREDGILEAGSALLLLVASYLALRIAWSADRTGVTYMHAFLALLFFAMAGEEVSWGQRILNFETPEALLDLNAQQEVNLHNMAGYFFDHLFILCFFLWGCIVPILYWAFRPWRWFQSCLGLPFPSVGLAIMALLVTIGQEQVTDALLGAVPLLRVAELREFLSAIFFVLLMVEARHLVPSFLLSTKGVPAE